MNLKDLFQAYVLFALIYFYLCGLLIGKYFEIWVGLIWGIMFILLPMIIGLLVKGKNE
jgi:hypothetical protein